MYGILRAGGTRKNVSKLENASGAFASNQANGKNGDDAI